MKKYAVFHYLIFILIITSQYKLYSEPEKGFNHHTYGEIQENVGQFYDNVQLGILDKVTGRVLKKSLNMNEPLIFGTLVIEVKKCWHSASSTHPETKAFLIIHNTLPNGHLDMVFKNWMFASTPSISTLEHPVYDVWVIGINESSKINNLSKSSKEENEEKLNNILKKINTDD